MFLLLAAWSAAAGAAEDVYLGEARDKNGALLYTEKHTVSSSNKTTTGSLTEYRAPDGALIATMRSDYSRSVAMPTYVFEDLRRDYREGLRWKVGEYVIFTQQGAGEEKTAGINGDSGVFSCQGWHYYLVNNLDLLEKDNIILRLVLPSEMRALPFVVKKLASDESRVSAELRLKHWLFRYFAPKLRLVYDKKDRRLLEYHGISNILDKDGERQDVNIFYSYNVSSPTVHGSAATEQGRATP